MMKSAAFVFLIGMSLFGFHAGTTVFYAHPGGVLGLEVTDPGNGGLTPITITPMLKTRTGWVWLTNSVMTYEPERNTSWGYCFTSAFKKNMTAYVVPLGGGSIGLYDVSTHKVYYPFNP